MRLDERLRDRGPGAPVRPGNDLAQLLIVFAALAAILGIWGGVVVVQRALEPPPPDPTLANRRAISVESPAEWITSDDYPPDAIVAGEQGTVAVLFTVNRWGRATDCVVTQSSRSRILDRQTCSLVEDRARYTAARDAAGAAIDSRHALRFRWVLPE